MSNKTLIHIISSSLAASLVFALPVPVRAQEDPPASENAAVPAEEVEPAQATQALEGGPEEAPAEGSTEESAEEISVEDMGEPVPEEPAAEPEPTPAAPAVPAYDPDNEPPPEPRIAGKPRTGKGLMIAGGTTLGVGILASFGAAALTTWCSYSGPLHCKHNDQKNLLIPGGVTIALTGAVILGVGVAYHLGYKRWERWTPGQDKKKTAKKTAQVVAPIMIRGGGGLGYVASF